VLISGILQPRRVRKGETMRAAYHGHLTQLAARLQTSEHGLLQATLDMNRAWQAFKAAHLDAQLLLEDRNSWEVDMPAEQMPGDDINDMSGVCSMDAYGQSDFDTADVCTLLLTLPSHVGVAMLLPISEIGLHGFPVQW